MSITTFPLTDHRAESRREVASVVLREHGVRPGASHSIVQPVPVEKDEPRTECAKILVVDDEAPLRDFLASLFEDLGHEVVTAINGRQALDAARVQHPDVVLADVMMPEMGGVELTVRLRAGEAGDPAVRVILMSAAGRTAARTANADAFIDKPFDLDAMVDLVEGYLGQGSEST